MRWTLAILTVTATSLVAAGVWMLGQARYLEDYCLARIEPPSTTAPEALSGRPAYLRDPWTVACEFDGLPTVYTTDPGLLIAAVVLGVIVVVVAAAAFRWASAALL